MSKRRKHSAEFKRGAVGQTRWLSVLTQGSMVFVRLALTHQQDH